MDNFKDKIAVVTGGASGIGRAVSEELGRRKAQVVVTDINAAGAAKVADGIVNKGGRANSKPVDTSVQEAVESLIDETVAKYGRLDYIFNNAGIGLGGDVRDLELEHWQKVISVNLWGVIYGTQYAYKIMAKQGFGHIVNTASLAGLIPAPVESPYGTTKFAVVGLSRSLRREGIDLGVKVSVVCPGFVDTGIFDTSVMINADMHEMLAKSPIKLFNVNKAAKVILRGVSKNKAVIIFPLHAKILLWLDRYLPPVSDILWNKFARDFRSIRKV